MPFFTIVIPTYNRADFIIRTLASALQQDFEDYTVIVVDDGSTDDTETKVRQAFPDNPQLKYIKQPNRERGAARNNGFRNAEGDYVVFLDSDDLLYPNHLSSLKTAIDKEKEVNFIASKYEIVRSGKTIPSTMQNIKQGWHNIELFLKGNPLACHFCVRRKNPAIRLFEEDRKYSVIEDWMFLVSNLYTDRIYIVDRVTASLSDHPGRSMRINHQTTISKHILATEWIEENFELNNRQRKILWGHSFLFCAIHNYLDNNRKQALSFLIKAAGQTGISLPMLVLLIKSLAGFSLIQRIKIWQ